MARLSLNCDSEVTLHPNPEKVKENESTDILPISGASEVLLSNDSLREGEFKLRRATSGGAHLVMWVSDREKLIGPALRG